MNIPRIQRVGGKRAAGSRTLRAVHRRVRKTQKIIRRQTITREARDTDADLRHDRDTLSLIGFGHRGAKPLGDFKRTVLTAPFEPYRKFVATKAR